MVVEIGLVLQMSHKSSSLYVMSAKNKGPTWYFMQRCYKIGSGWCVLHKMNDDTVAHLFIHFPFTLQVWSFSRLVLGQSYIWNGEGVEGVWRR